LYIFFSRKIYTTMNKFHEHNFQKKNLLFGFHKCIYCSKIEMLTSLYKCKDCDDYCHRKCYNESTNPAIENGNNEIMGTYQNENRSRVEDDPVMMTTKLCRKRTKISGFRDKFVQPIATVYSTFIQKRCMINHILEELYKIFPEVLQPPYNGFFFGSSNTTIIIP